MWAATNRGLYYYSSVEYFKAQKAASIYLKGHNVGMVTEIKKGDYWIVAEKVYKLQNGQLSSFNETNGFPANTSIIYSDAQGISWFASKKGLSRLPNEYYRFYNLQPGPMHSMTITINKDKNNNLWLGSFDGLTKKQQQTSPFTKK